MPETLKELQQRHQEWIDIVNKCDAEAYADLLTEDAVWFPPEGDAIEGRKAFKQWLTPFFGRFEYDFTITDERFRSAGASRAIEKASFITEMTPQNGGEPMRHTGTFTVLWFRGNEVWHIERYIDDSNMQVNK